MATPIINTNLGKVVTATGNIADDLSTLRPLLKNMLFAAFPTDKIENAPIASFPDGADNVPVKSATFNIDPVQDLHGYDAPWPAGGGKNLLNVTEQVSVSNVTLYSDGRLLVNGTFSATTYVKLNDSLTLPSGTYILSGNSPSTVNIYLYDDSTFGGWGGNNSYTKTLVSETTGKIYVRIAPGTYSNVLIEPMVRLSTEADATFAPYSNICPISGWDGANIYTKGENLFEPVNVTGTNNGVTFAWVNGICTVTGTATALAINGPTNRTLPAGTYTVMNFNCTAGTGVFVSDTSVRPWATIANTLTHTDESGNGWDTFTLTKMTTVAIRGRVNSGVTVDNAVITPMVVSGTVRPSAYAAYTSTTIPITWSDHGTVYGGLLEYLGGDSWRLTADSTKVTLNGSENWVKASENQGFWLKLNTLNKRSNYSDSIICDKLQTFISNSDPSYVSAEYGITGYLDGNNLYPTQNWLYAKGGGTGFKAWLAANPITVVYTLSTPVTYDLTGEELATVLGDNNVFSNTGDVTGLVYRADTALFVEKKLAE